MSLITVANVLLLVIVGLLLQRGHPDFTHTLFVLAAVVLGYEVLNHYFMEWRRRRFERRKQEAERIAHATEWREYQRKSEAIRRKYDPDHKWNEGTSLPKEYVEEFRRLRDDNIELLRREFGPDEMP